MHRYFVTAIARLLAICCVPVSRALANDGPGAQLLLCAKQLSRIRVQRLAEHMAIAILQPLVSHSQTWIREENVVSQRQTHMVSCRNLFKSY